MSSHPIALTNTGSYDKINTMNGIDPTQRLTALAQEVSSSVFTGEQGIAQQLAAQTALTCSYIDALTGAAFIRDLREINLGIPRGSLRSIAIGFAESSTAINPVRRGEPSNLDDEENLTGLVNHQVIRSNLSDSTPVLNDTNRSSTLAVAKFWKPDQISLLKITMLRRIPVTESPLHHFMKTLDGNSAGHTAYFLQTQSFIQAVDASGECGARIGNTVFGYHIPDSEILTEMFGQTGGLDVRVDPTHVFAALVDGQYQLQCRPASAVHNSDNMRTTELTTPAPKDVLEKWHRRINPMGFLSALPI